MELDFVIKNYCSYCSDLDCWEELFGRLESHWKIGKARTFDANYVCNVMSSWEEDPDLLRCCSATSTTSCSEDLVKSSIAG